MSDLLRTHVNEASVIYDQAESIGRMAAKSDLVILTLRRQDEKVLDKLCLTQNCLKILLDLLNAYKKVDTRTKAEVEAALKKVKSSYTVAFVDVSSGEKASISVQGRTMIEAIVVASMNLTTDDDRFEILSIVRA